MDTEKKMISNMSDCCRRWSAMALVGLLMLMIICNLAMADEPQVEVYYNQETLRVDIRGNYIDEFYHYLLSNQLPHDWFGYIEVSNTKADEEYGIYDDDLNIRAAPIHRNPPDNHNHPKSSVNIGRLFVDVESFNYYLFEDLDAVPHDNHTDLYFSSIGFPPSDSGPYTYEYEYELLGSHLSWDYEKFKKWLPQANPNTPSTFFPGEGDVGRVRDLFWRAILYPDKETSDTEDKPAGKLYILIDPTENSLWGTGFFNDEQGYKFDLRLINKEDEPIYFTIISPTENGSPARSFLIDGVSVQPDEMNKILEESGKGGLNVEIQPEGQPPLKGQLNPISFEFQVEPPDQDKWVRSVTFLGSWPLNPTGGGNKRHPPEVLNENHVGNVTVDQVLSGKEKIEATGDWIGLGDEKEPYVVKYVGIAVYNKSGEPVEADFRLRSDDGVKALVNNEEKLKDSRVQEPGDPGNTTQGFSATLKPGWNVVVVAIYNVTLGMGFRMCITNPATGEAFDSSILDMTPDIKATNPYPADGATGVALNTPLRFEPGIGAVKHELTFDFDNDGLVYGPAEIDQPDINLNELQQISGWGPLSPEYYASVYWRIDGIDRNGNKTIGNPWTFSTGNYFLIENFENPDSARENMSTFGGGSFDIVPDFTQPDVPTEQVYPKFTEGGGGDYTLAFSYNNTEDTPNSGLILDLQQTNLQDAVNNEQNEDSVFTLDIRGFTNNDPASLYLETTDISRQTAIQYHPDPDIINNDQWTQLIFSLSDFVNQGENLENIQSVSIGVGDPIAGLIFQSVNGGLLRAYNLNNAAAAVTGTIFIDNIEFHPNGIDRQQNLLSNPDFESGNETGWTHPLCDMLATSDQVHSGNYSAYIYNRTDTWQGPRHSVLGQMQNGKTYSVSIWVKLENAQSDNIALTVLQTDASGSNYTYLQWSTGYSNRWVQLSGTYTLNATGTVTELQVYVEGPQAGINFYVDDALVEEQ